MENASKALLIAGSILLFILLSSFMAYIFTRARNKTSEIYSMMSTSKVDSFNQKFLKYEDKELNIQDIVSIINLAKDCNRSGKQPVEIKVTATRGIIDGTSETNLLSDSININDILEKNIYDEDGNKKKYKCTANYGDNSNLIENILIENY